MARKMISFMAKRTEGMMARHIIEHRLERPEDDQQIRIAEAGLQFDEAMPTDTTWTFFIR